MAKPTVHVHVTELKSDSLVELQARDTCVRIFVDHDVHYGYFVPEVELWKRLTAEQQELYFKKSDPEFLMDVAYAQQLIDMGMTPYRKQKLQVPAEA